VTPAEVGQQLWSERFDREMKDVFEVQDEMARKIAEALRVTLSPRNSKPWRSSPRGKPPGRRPVPARQALCAAPDPPGLLCRALFAAGRHQEVLDVAEAAIEASGEDYNVYVPIGNSLGAMGKEEAKRNMTQRRMSALENHLKQVPEDARARILLGGDYAQLGRPDDAVRELNLAVTLRANEASILYNAACVYCGLNKKMEAMDALRKAWEAGFRDSVWARRDPDLIPLHDDPEFDRLYPEKPASPPVSGSH
jgi:tetratricopeptide (TPR) repeat protein